MKEKKFTKMKTKIVPTYNPTNLSRHKLKIFTFNAYDLNDHQIFLW